MWAQWINQALFDMRQKGKKKQSSLSVLTQTRADRSLDDHISSDNIFFNDFCPTVGVLNIPPAKPTKTQLFPPQTVSVGFKITHFSAFHFSRYLARVPGDYCIALWLAVVGVTWVSILVGYSPRIGSQGCYCSLQSHLSVFGVTQHCLLVRIGHCNACWINEIPKRSKNRGGKDRTSTCLMFTSYEKTAWLLFTSCSSSVSNQLQSVLWI